MLERLIRIDWTKLEHAHGPATDVPPLIRALAADDAAIRARALARLNETIWQQGAVFQATASAVPFLVEVAAEPGVPDRGGVVLLLARIATGGALLDVHSDRFLEGADTPALRARRQRERGWARTATEAVEQGTLTNLKLLYDADVQVRIAVPYLLAALPTQAVYTVPALDKRLGESGEPRVRASVLLALGALASPSPEALQQLSAIIIAENPPLVKLAAAGTLALLERERTPPAAAALLAEAIAQPDPKVLALYGQLPWCKSGLVGDLAATFAWLGPEVGGFAVPLLCRALGAVGLEDPGTTGEAAPQGGSGGSGPIGADHSAVLNLVHALLRIAFGDRSRSRPLILARLSEHQRIALTAIAQADAIWRHSAAVTALLGALGLPNTRAALRQSLQLPV
ncbi:MAG TPA: HEAT repeat domain-containing protein [Ktedonobacterales bacterium]|jgi:hypothetical protein